MRVVRPGGFERALGALDRDALAAFVAGLWAAGGWETSVEGPLVVAERSGRRRRIGVVAADRGLDRLRRVVPAARNPADGNLDVVVDASRSGRVAAAAQAAGAEYVPPAALRDRLLYGVPREVGAALSERHLDRSLERIRSQSAAGRLAAPRSVLLGAALVVLVVVALAAGPHGLLSGGPEVPAGATATVQSDADGPTPSGATAGGSTATAGASTATARASAATGTETSAGPSYPPGISTAGVDDVSALADAHVVATRNRRYALNVSFEGPAWATGFEDFESVRWSLRVEKRRHFRIDARYRRVNISEPRWIRLGIYADGVTMFSRTVTPGETQYVASSARAGEALGYRHFAPSLIERYLDTKASIVRPTETPDGPRYHVVARGTPTRLNDSVADYRAEALVTPAGRVTTLSVQYTIESNGDERDVQVRFEYVDYGTAHVEPPDWYDEARNETDREDRRTVE